MQNPNFNIKFEYRQYTATAKRECGKWHRGKSNRQRVISLCFLPLALYTLPAVKNNLERTLMKKIILSILCIIIIMFLFDNQISYLKNYLIGNFSIMGKGESSAGQLSNFLLKRNKTINSNFVHNLADDYIREASVEKVNWDVAFCQMCLETNFLKFGGQITINRNNFAGIGATDDGAIGASFSSPEEGVRAQIQHLKAYASTTPLHNKTVDPRFGYVRRGSAKYIFDLGNGNWASDPYYAGKLSNLIEKLHSM